MPSNRYPTSSKNRLDSPLLRNSVILFRGFIMFGGRYAVGALALPLAFLGGVPLWEFGLERDLGVDAEGASSSGRPTPHLSRREE